MASAQPSNPRTGSCLCGNVKYTITGQPFMSAICHCTNCQKITGSALAANAMFNKSASRLSQQIKLESGQDSIRSYRDEAVDSGNVLSRSFCTNCGSSLYLENVSHPKMKDVIVIMTGGIDGDKSGFKPKRELFDNRRYACLSVQQGTARL